VTPVSEQYFGSRNRVLLITKALPWLLFESNLETAAGQTVRPLESIAETEPQLKPALLRLSAIILPAPFHAARFCLFCSPHSNEKMILNGRNDAGDVIGRRKRGGDVPHDARPKLQAPRGKETRLPSSFIEKIVSRRAMLPQIFTESISVV
jgi:hypothetical protein